MKKIVSLILCVLLLMGVCLTGVACTLENPTGYTQLRDHLNEVTEAGQSLTLLDNPNGISVTVAPESNEGIVVSAVQTNGQTYTHLLTVTLKNGAEKYDVNYSLVYMGMLPMASASASILVHNYTGLDVLAFDEYQDYINSTNDFSFRENITQMLNTALLALDKYCQTEVSISVDDLGFASLSNLYRYTVDDASAEEDLGGAFSAERLKLAGVMIVVGLGMVFLVLAILWGVLVIFKKVMYDAPKQREAKAAASAPSAPTAPAVADAPDGAEIAAVAGAVAYAQDDGAVVAAITAAIAEMIASDEHLSQEFAGGFRVVSFSRKSGKGAWNR